MSNTDKMYIYVSLQDDMTNQVDEDLTYDTEEKAIDAFINHLSDVSNDVKEKYDKGKDIKLYLYQLDTDRIPRLYKSVEVEKDDKEKKGYEVDEDETYDLPKDFTPFSNDSQSDKNDDQKEEDTEDDEEKDTKEKKGSSEKETSDDETDSEDDVREVEEACNIFNILFDYFEAGLITEEAITLDLALLEAVIGRKSVIDAKRDMIQAKKDTKKWFHYRHTHDIPDEDKEKFEGPEKLGNFVDKEMSATHVYDNTVMDYTKQRSAADRLKQAKQANREKKIGELRTNIQHTANAAKSKVSNVISPKKPTVTESVNFKKSIYVDSLLMLESMYSDGFLPNRLYSHMKDSIMSTALEKTHKSEFFSESVDHAYVNALMIMEETKANLESVLPERINISFDMENNYLIEKVLSRSARKDLDDDQFGIPSLRKYPIHDKAHVTAAINRFNFVDAEHEKELATNIIRAIKEFKMMDTVRVGKLNKFKKYLDESYKTFKESFDIYPVPYAREFNVGAMLPMMGSRAGWGTPLADTDIEDLIAKDNKELENSAYLYDCSTLYNESFTLKRNLIFDSEVSKLAKSIGPYIDNPKNKFMEDILNKSIGINKNNYRIKLKDNDGKDASKIIKKIESLGFTSKSDEGVKTIFEKKVQNLLITVLYDSVTDNLRITYENPNTKRRFKNESVDDFELMIEAVDYDFYCDMLDERYNEIRPQIETANITSKQRALARITLYENYQKAQKYFEKMKTNNSLFTKLKRFLDINGILSKKQIKQLFDDYLLLSEHEILELTSKKNKVKQDKRRNRAEYFKLLFSKNSVAVSVHKECSNDNLYTTLEASKDDIDSDIRGIIDKLNELGYTTKYSCSGHTKSRIKEDVYRNGIYRGKLYTTARIVFADDYKLDPPEGWEKRTFDGKIGFYVKEKNYQYDQGMPDDAFDKWKEEYMKSLSDWVKTLKKKPGPESNND